MNVCFDSIFIKFLSFVQCFILFESFMFVLSCYLYVQLPYEL